MPKLTAKECQAKRRAKIRENPESYQSYLRKDRERKKKKRYTAAQSLTPSKLAEHRMKESQRVKQYREKKAVMMHRLSHQHLLHHIAALKQALKDSSNPFPLLLERGVV